jgi:hypothetical protein
MTRLYELVIELQEEDTHIGDLCKAILTDMKFPKYENQENQIIYLINLAEAMPNASYAIDDFIRMLIDEDL